MTGGNHGQERLDAVQVRALLRTCRHEIRRRFRAEIIGLFGSYARGEETPESDVDLLVRFEEGATLFDFVGLSDYLNDLLGIKVDLVTDQALRKELEEEVKAEVVPV